jgi:hypothetical protein
MIGRWFPLTLLLALPASAQQAPAPELQDLIEAGELPLSAHALRAQGVDAKLVASLIDDAVGAGWSAGSLSSALEVEVDDLAKGGAPEKVGGYLRGLIASGKAAAELGDSAKKERSGRKIAPRGRARGGRAPEGEAHATRSPGSPMDGGAEPGQAHRVTTEVAPKPPPPGAEPRRKEPPPSSSSDSAPAKKPPPPGAEPEPTPRKKPAPEN